jgi:hypothetical protein
LEIYRKYVKSDLTKGTEQVLVIRLAQSFWLALEFARLLLLEQQAIPKKGVMMKNKEKSMCLCRSRKTTFLPAIAVVWSVLISQASVAIAYSPSQQSSDNGINVFWCFWSVILIVAIAIAYTDRDRTRKAPEYMQRLSTPLLRLDLEAIVNELFPKGSWVSSSFGWKRDSNTEGILALSRNYFSPKQGCLLYLVTGLLPGVLILSLMGRTERVTVDMSALETNNEIMVKGQGLRGREGFVKELLPACHSERAQRVKNPRRLNGDSSASPQNDMR